MISVVAAAAGDTPLCYSAFAGKAAATKYLLAHGADPLLGKNFLPLHGAACQGLFLSQNLYLRTTHLPHVELHI
jgi:ankyrin repeat protein